MTTVLITGCSRGFGLAGAKAFAEAGDQVIATVRDPDSADALKELALNHPERVSIRKLDVTRSADFPSFVAQLEQDYGAVDVLVNNAGVIYPGACEDLTEQQIRRVMETNFFAPMLLSRALLPGMRARACGTIIMVSSLSGLAGLAGDVFYSASKFALEGATEALRHEVDRWGIRVALLEAAQYATGIFDRALSQDSLLPADYPSDSPYKPLIASRMKAIHEGFEDARDPNVVARLMLEIARSDGSRLRWQADDLAEMVHNKLFAQSDAERDAFLRAAGDSDWWSEGRNDND